MSLRDATWLAWYMCAVSLMLTVFGLVLLIVSQSPVGAPVYAGAPVFDYWLVNSVIAPRRWRRRRSAFPTTRR